MGYVLKKVAISKAIIIYITTLPVSFKNSCKISCYNLKVILVHIGHSQYVQAPMEIDHKNEDRISVNLRMKNPFLLTKLIYISVLNYYNLHQYMKPLCIF